VSAWVIITFFSTSFAVQHGMIHIWQAVMALQHMVIVVIAGDRKLQLQQFE
jgi:hypothetical protein